MTENQQTDALFSHLFGSLNRYDPDSESGFCLAERGEFLRRDEVLAAATYQRKRDRDAVAGLPIMGVSRMFDNPKALLLLLGRAPTDDEVRDIQSALSATTEPTSQRGETEAEHIARDMRKGRFPDRSPRQTDTPPAPVAAPDPVPAPAAEPVAFIPPHILERLLQGTGGCFDMTAGNGAGKKGCTVPLYASPPPSAAPTDTALVEALRDTDDSLYKLLYPFVGDDGSTRVLRMELRKWITAALASRPAAPAEGDVGALVDDVDVQGWAAFKCHALPTAIARLIAEKVNERAALRPQSSAQGGER